MLVSSSKCMLSFSEQSWTATTPYFGATLVQVTFCCRVLFHWPKHTLSFSEQSVYCNNALFWRDPRLCDFLLPRTIPLASIFGVVIHGVILLLALITKPPAWHLIQSNHSLQHNCALPANITLSINHPGHVLFTLHKQAYAIHNVMQYVQNIMEFTASRNIKHWWHQVSENTATMAC